MDGKLRQLMKHEGINSTRLAEILEIQASGISHIMSGRNKPSYDFLTRLLKRFPQISSDWLLLDKGPMYRDEIKSRGAGNTGNAGNAGNAGTGNYRTGTGLGGTENERGDAGYAGVGGMNPGGVGRSSGMVSDVATPYNAGGGPGGGNVNGDRIGGGNGNVNVNRDSTGWGNVVGDGGLFAPDNNDIIPSGVNRTSNFGPNPGANAGSTPGVNRNQATGMKTEMLPRPESTAPKLGMKTEMSSNYPAQPQPTRPKYPEHPMRQANETPTPATPESNGGQHDIFARRAYIERIVVFYKDKTFSEYCPER